MKLGIVIPAWNEEKRIGATLEAYGKFFNRLVKDKELDYELLIVVNNSTDKTEEIVRKFQKKYRRFKLLLLKEGGKGNAIIEGFKELLKGKFDLIGFVDADMATSPEAFYHLVKNINDCDGAIASRWKKGAIVENRSFLRGILSGGFNFIVRSMFLIRQTDTQCGAKVFKKKVIEEIVPEFSLTEWAFDVNLLYLCKRKKFKIREVATIWRDVEGSNIDVMKAPIQMFSGVLRLRLMYSVFEPILRPVKFILRIGNRLLKKNEL